MAYVPIVGIAPQYEDQNGWFLKFYKPDETTPVAMSIDDTGNTLLAKAELDVNGFITTDGETLFIPFLDQTYTAFLFPTAAEANANDTVNAFRIAKNINPFGDNFDLDIVKLPVVLVDSQVNIPVPDAPETINLYISGRNQFESFDAYNYTAGLAVLDEPFPAGTEVEIQYGMIIPKTTITGGGLLTFPTAAQMAAATIDAGTVVLTEGYSYPGDAGAAKYEIQEATSYSGTAGFLDLSIANGNVAKNLESDLTGSMAGILSNGVDFTVNLQELASALNPQRSLYIDSTSFSLSGFVLFNNGYKKVSHASGSKVTWLGAGELSTTTKAIYSVNMDASGIKTNETLIGLTTVSAVFSDSAFTVNSVSGLTSGDVIRIEKHVCRIEDINGLVIQTDRTLPILLQSSGSEVVRLNMPNIGSEFSGPSLFQFAPDALTQNYGFGIVLANCFSTKVNNFYGLHNSSKVCEVFYCADSEASNIQQYEPADIAAGQGYTLRISNGNDNIAREITSSKGRHCVDITFSHRNKVFDCKAYNHVSSPFLTHFNGCVYNDFIRCESHQCSQGVSISYDGDDYNRYIDGVFIESQGAYRPTATTEYINCTFKTTIVNGIMVLLNPRTNGESILNWKGGSIETVNKICNVDVDYTVNLSNGDFKLQEQFGLFRGIDSGTPGAPTSTAIVVFNFSNMDIDVPVTMGRNNINSKITFDRCTIEYDTQPFEQDTGDQKYLNCSITDRLASSYLITVGSGNNCELLDCRLYDITLPFRYFAGFPATGHITFGDNTLLGASTYNPNGLDDMAWLTAGYVSMPLSSSNDGSPDDGSIAYIDSDVTTDPFKRKRVAAAWVDWII